jgi:hypothetical protein
VAYLELYEWSVTFWGPKGPLLGRCDPDLDPGACWGLERPKNQSSHNDFKTDVYVGLVDMNQMQHERAQMDFVCS